MLPGMSLFVRQRSSQYRLRVDGEVVAARTGPLHLGVPMLEWGSVGKTVTARLAELLDAAGAVALATPVVDVLPETELPAAVDVRALVTHTSGLPRLPPGIISTIAEARDPYAKYTTAYFDAEVLPQLAQQLAGGQRSFEYSNLGYAVLTRLLERATGETWWELAKQHVFAPLGISQVAVQPRRGDVPVLRNWAGNERKQWTDPGPFVGAGGLHGSFDALEEYAVATACAGPGRVPLGWMESARFWWYNGQTRDHGAFVAVSRDGARTIAVHTLGHRVGAADRIAHRIETRSSR